MSNIKQTILDSIKYVREDMGYTLISEDWGDANEKCTCAMGCVLLKDDPKDVVRIETKENAIKAAEILGVSEEWIDAFIAGFDVTGTAAEFPIPEAWELGFAVGTETRPIPYHLVTEVD